MILLLTSLLMAANPAPTARRAIHAPAPAKVAPAKPLPIFSFMGDDTETASQRVSLNGTKCSQTGAKLECTDYNDPVIAGKQTKWLSLRYNSGMLYSVFSSFGEYAYPAIMTAFREKYGEPAVFEKRKWESKGGAVFDNMVAVWHFKGGDLEVDQMGLDINSGSFDFSSSANQPAPDKPKVDF